MERVRVCGEIASGREVRRRDSLPRRRRATHAGGSHVRARHQAPKALGGQPVVIAHDETAGLLKRAADPNRPLPTVTFSDRYTLRVGDQVLELSYHGNAHEPGNIFIHAPAQRVLMVVDVVFPGWMPWRRFALAQDIPGYFAQVEEDVYVWDPCCAREQSLRIE